jgi:hypothetical protein
MATLSFDPSVIGFPRDIVEKRRLAYLLSRLSPATPPTRKKLKSDGLKHAPVMGFSAESALDAIESLSQRDWIVVAPGRKGDPEKDVFHLLDAGREILRSLQIYQPDARSPRLEMPPETAAQKQGRRASLLFQLFKANDFSLTASQANKSIPCRDALELKPSLARLIRQELFEEGCLRFECSARTERYILTEAGITYLAGLEFWATGRFELNGEQLTKLLATRGRSTGGLPNSAPTIQAPKPAGDLRQTIFDGYEKLRTEKYFRTGGVPICELRAFVRERLGDQAASHEVFDLLMKELNREEKIRLEPITMDASVTKQQLEDSIPSLGRTMFFVEIAP